MGKQRDQRGCSVSVFVSRARGPPRRVLDSRERQCRARVHPIEEDPLRPNRKTRCAMGSSPVVNYFSPSAFSRRLVGGKKLVFVSFLSVDSDLGHTSAVHSAGEGPASSGDPSVSAGAASLFGLVTQQGPQQPRSLPSDCSRTEGLPWFLLQEAIGGPRQAKTGNLQSRPTMARAHFPPFGAKTSRGKAGEFAGSAQEGIYYGESRPDSGNLPKRREEKAFGGSKPNTGIVLIPNREFHHSSRDVKFSLNFPLFLQARQFSVPRRKIYSSSDPPVH